MTAVLRAVLVGLVAVASLASGYQLTALDEYIALPDPTYSYFDTVRVAVVSVAKSI